MTLSRQSFPVKNTITKQDRINVDLLARVADGDARYQRTGRTTFSLPEDTNLLVSNGFTIGFTGFSWFGRDLSGYLWRVTSGSQWSRNKEQSPVKPDKWEPSQGTMRLVEFYELFSTMPSKRSKTTC